MTVAELVERMSWVELLHWIAFYGWEAEQALPPEKRPVRVRTPGQAKAILDKI